MPITPDQAARPNARHEADFEYHTKRIDAALAEGGRTFQRANIPGPIIKRIIEVYEGLGWRVREVGDFRDGDYLEFSDARYEGPR